MTAASWLVKNRSVRPPGEFGWPYVAPPGTPPDRMAIYRTAFVNVLKDPQFRAEAAQQKVTIDALDDKVIQALLARAHAAPPAIRARAARLTASCGITRTTSRAGRGRSA